MDIEKVIHGVHERPALCDLKNKYYHNRDIVRCCWNEVAQECEVEGEQVKAKWKNLRDTFRNELKKCNKVRSGDEGGSMYYQSTWLWFEAMSFLKDVMTPRRMLSNLSQQDSAMGDFEQSDDSSIGSNDPGSNPSRPDVHIDDHQRGHSSSENSVELSGSMPPPPERPLKKKRNATDSELINIEKEKLKLIERQVSAAENHDDNYHFVMSLLPMMRKLPPDAQLRTRIKMQEILLKEMNDQTTTIASFFSSFPGNVEQTSSQFSTSTGYTQL